MARLSRRKRAESPAADSSAPENGIGGSPGRSRDEISALVLRAQRGDVLAMDELLGLLAPYVSRLCGPIALHDGQDAAQEAMIAIFRNIRHLKEPAALFGWVRAIAIREAVRFAARNNKTAYAELPDIPVMASPDLLTDIKDVLRRLSPEHRAVLVLRHMEGLDELAVSRILEVPVGTVRSRLFRARRSFRDAWG
jgi:RNA polymerase sigma factor (sigma-70 family)